MKTYPLTAKIPAALAMGMCLMLFTAKNSHATPTPTVDLTLAGSSGTINGALFLQADPHPAGSGYGALNAFLKIHSTADIESGYNTDYRYGHGNGPSSTEFDQFTNNHTRSLLLSEIPTIDIQGTTYRGFILDINEPVGPPGTGTSLLSLDALQIFLGDGPELHDYNTSLWNAHSEMIYDMDAGNDNWVGMDFCTNKGGSGWGDAYILIPEIFFTVSTNEYVYLYSKFGENWANDNNFEEWGVGACAPVPEPATMLLFGTGLAGLGTLLRRRQSNA